MKRTIQLLKSHTAVLYTAISIGFMSITNAQNVSISPTGNAPDNSAALDIRDYTDKGILIPRVSLTGPTDAATIPNPAHSLLVYNTSSAGGLSPGYYYNAGTTTSPQWRRLLNSGTPSDAWLTLGNGGTNSGIHFIGTTDNRSLRFRTNNVHRMVIDSLGRVGIGTTAPAAKLEVNGDIRLRAQLSTDGLGNQTFGERIILAGNMAYGWPTKGITYLGFPNHDGAFFVPVGTGTQTSDLRLYITDDWDDRFSIWGGTCAGGACSQIDSAKIVACFLGGGNVGIGTTAPTERLDVVGNVKFSGALMPANNAGSTGQVLVSQGVGTAPQWFALMNELNASGAPTGNTGFKICFGQSNNWYDCNGSNGCSYNTGIIIDINMSGCGFTSPPYVFTSIKGTSSHWMTTGATSIYNLTSTSFRVYVHGYLYGGSGLNVSTANTYSYYLMWMAIGR